MIDLEAIKARAAKACDETLPGWEDETSAFDVCRDDVPALVAEVERLRAIIKRAHADAVDDCDVVHILVEGLS